jgi:hypothetical protein
MTLAWVFFAAGLLLAVAVAVALPALANRARRRS